MPTVDPNDPTSLERAYPIDAFTRDAAQNARTAVAEVHGVRITAGAAPGSFEVVPAKRHAGETPSDGMSIFLAPHRSNEATVVAEAHAGYGGPQAVAAPRPASPRGDYEAFLERVAEAIRTADFPEPIGRHDDRLKGLRGG
jgi:hypothetical protein